MLLVIRHNLPYVTKVHEVSVELMGIALTQYDAKKHVDDEIEDYASSLGDLEVEKPSDWVECDGVISRLNPQMDMAYDIIHVSGQGWPDKYIRLAGF